MFAAMTTHHEDSMQGYNVGMAQRAVHADLPQHLAPLALLHGGQVIHLEGKAGASVPAGGLQLVMDGLIDA